MSGKIRITEGPLDESPAVWDIPDAGAIVVFDGRVRGIENGRPIAGLNYTAYRPMVDEQLQRLAEDLLERHAIQDIAVEHSVGFVPTGACSFRLHVAAAHRKAALKSMDEFIDAMKRDIPIWKEAVEKKEKA